LILEVKTSKMLKKKNVK